jgi:hypothetical protein
VVTVTEMALDQFPRADRPSKGSQLGTKTITLYVSDIDQSEIPAGQAYQLSIRHPDGSTQQLDISDKNYRDLKLAGVGKTLKKRGAGPSPPPRRPGSHASARPDARTASRPPPPDREPAGRSPRSSQSRHAGRYGSNAA